jgi:hypothetical protein
MTLDETFQARFTSLKVNDGAKYKIECRKRKQSEADWLLMLWIVTFLNW